MSFSQLMYLFALQKWSLQRVYSCAEYSATVAKRKALIMTTLSCGSFGCQ